MHDEARPHDHVAAINHEIRTPLNAILGFSDLLATADGLAEPHRRYAAHIHASGRRLFALIDQVLALAESASAAGLGEDLLPPSAPEGREA